VRETYPRAVFRHRLFSPSGDNLGDSNSDETSWVGDTFTTVDSCDPASSRSSGSAAPRLGRPVWDPCGTDPVCPVWGPVWDSVRWDSRRPVRYRGAGSARGKHRDDEEDNRADGSRRAHGPQDARSAAPLPVPCERIPAAGDRGGALPLVSRTIARLRSHVPTHRLQ
jgi:hypothetical protein